MGLQLIGCFKIYFLPDFEVKLPHFRSPGGFWNSQWIDMSFASTLIYVSRLHHHRTRLCSKESGLPFGWCRHTGSHGSHVIRRYYSELIVWFMGSITPYFRVCLGGKTYLKGRWRHPTLAHVRSLRGRYCWFRWVSHLRSQNLCGHPSRQHDWASWCWYYQEVEWVTDCGG